MKTINRLFFLFAAFLNVVNAAKAQCNSSNSPTFQVSATQVTFAVNGVCGALIYITNASTNPIPGGPVSYSIFPPGQSTNTPPPPTPSVITVGGVWTVIVRDNTNNCATAQTVQINTIPAPNISLIASNTLVCAGYPATITAYGANSYVWSNGATTSSIIVNPTSPSTFVVIGTSTDVCSSFASINVNVNPIPNLTGTVNPNNVCANQSITLTAGGATSYTWSNMQIGASTTITPAVSANYTVYGTNEFGCESSRQFIVTVSPCTGIEDFSKSNPFKISPNPANNLVELTILNDALTAGVVIVTIHNALGQIVRQEEVSRKEKTIVINTSDLPEDLYFVKIENAEFGTTTKKLIVQH